jgi:hypothetical protein
LTYSTCNFLDDAHEPEPISSQQVKISAEKHKNQTKKLKEVLSNNNQDDEGCINETLNYDLNLLLVKLFRTSIDPVIL